MIGGKQMDPVLGIDIHIIQPPGPVPPVPIPHPFIGMVMDPMDFAPFIGATVYVNVMPRAQAGSGGMGIPPHIPIGGVFVKPPASECEVFMGSATVAADGDALTSLGLPCLSCSDVGMPAPPRPKGSAPASLMLPTSVVLCIPMGMPVLVGGPPTISLTAMAMKAAMFLGGKLLKKLKGSKFWKKMSDKLHDKADDLMRKLKVPEGLRDKVHKGICTLTGHPVDVATGRVLTDAVDFELPGPIPLKWERTWYSTSDYRGPLGHGWHHAYDLALSASETAVAVRLEDGRGVAFPALEVGEAHFNRFERLTLFRDTQGYALRTRDSLVYRFRSLGGRGDQQVLSSIETLAGDRVVFDYHPSGVLRRILDSGGRELLVRSDTTGRILEVLAPHPSEPDARVSLVQYRYDGEGDLIEVFDALRQRMRFAYEDHLLVREIDHNGLSFYFQYAGSGPGARCMRTWGDGGIYDHKLVYDDEARVTRVTDSLGHTVSYRYDDAGLVIKTIDARGGVSQVEYSAWNEKLCEIDALGQKTFYEYDDLGNTILVLGPDGAKLQVQYDPLGNPLEAIDPNGGRWQWRYDDRGRLLERIDPLGCRSRFQYDVTRLIGFTDPAGQVTRLQHDRSGNLLALTAPDGTTSRWEYDRLGRVVAAVDPRGNLQRRTVDLLGRVIEVLEPDGNLRQVRYDGEGNPLRVRDRQHDVTFTYSGMGRLASRSEAGTTVRFEYDTEEQLVAIQNEHGYVYRFDLDPNGDVALESGFDGVRRVYVRDLAGRVSEVRRASGLTTAYGYDAAGRVLEVKHSDGTKERYQYRRDGELIQALNEASQVRFERDAMGRVVREWQGQYWVASEYDVRGLRVGMRSSLGAEQLIERNELGDVLRVRHRQWESKSGSVKAEWEARFARDVMGEELERTLPGGVRSRWQRDRLGRPVQHEVLAGARKWREVQYTWDVNDRLRQVIDLQKGVTRYGHDALGNLASAQYGDGVLELRMPDAVGNLFKREDRRDRRYGRAGELLEADGPGGVTRYTYDAEGNLVAKVQPDGGVWRYHWNAAGMLARVERPDGEVVAFAYDALGRRVAKTFRGRTTRWVWDGNNPLHEWIEGGDLEQDSRREAPPIAPPLPAPLEATLAGHPPLGPPAVIPQVPPGLIPLGPPAGEPVEAPFGPKERLHRAVDGMITWVFEPDSFAPAAKLVGAQRYSIVTDYLGTPVAMLDDAGDKVWAADISIYGELRNLEGRRDACPFRWPGQYEDLETGLYYNRFRYYDPEGGTYVSQDPIGLLGGIACCAYVRDPLIFVDPFGLESCAAKIKKLKAGEDVTVKSFKEADEVLFGAFPNAKKVKGAGNKSAAKVTAQKKAFKRAPEGSYHKDYLHNTSDPHGSLHGHESLPEGHPHKTTPHVNVMTPEGKKATIFIDK